MLHWRADGKELFFRGQNLESNELLVMSVDVTTTPTFSAGTPKLLFKLPGPIGGNLGNISHDGQRFVFAVNVSAPSSTESRYKNLRSLQPAEVRTPRPRCPRRWRCTGAPLCGSIGRRW